ncbi:uncharacterized protein LOC115328143 [Ixodes scapularis]|uniref:uncharacterized protein LOC115328143 n=1 Tax=Ixodes scapularis TaxID=6945 RepID=UPI001A9F5AFF|nr:uncharacterized protein LOC115328143 [Ixodes scapularis]
MAIRKQSIVSFVALLSLTVLSFGVHQVNPEDCPFWKDIAASDGFQQYIVAASELAHVDIAVPPEFGVDERFALAQLLRKAPISVRVLRGTSALFYLHQRGAVDQDRHALVLVFCKSTAWDILSIILSHPYVMHLYVISDDPTGYAFFLQQGCPATRGSERFLSLRFILGTCALCVTVLATGYKGVTVSLFSNVPLAGESITATTPVRDFRLCVLSNVFTQEVEGIKSHELKKCVKSSGKIKIGNDGKDQFMIVGSGYDEFKDKLIDRNCIESVVSQVPTGPEIRTISPYRNAMSNLFSRAFEAGIFKHHVSLSNHKRSVTREFKTHKGRTNEDPVTLRDLRPCFVIWGGRIFLSVAVFIIQIVIHITQGLTLPWNRCRVHKL